MDGIAWSRISVAVRGKGYLRAPLLEALRRRYPGIVIYDRDEQLRRKASGELHLMDHLEVADVDVFFAGAGAVEHLTVRCLARHRAFNYLPERLASDRTGQQLLLRRLLDLLPQLILPPPPPVAVDAADENEAGVEAPAGDEIALAEALAGEASEPMSDRDDERED